MDHLKLQVGNICNFQNDDFQKVFSLNDFNDSVKKFLNLINLKDHKQFSITVCGQYDHLFNEIISAGIENFISHDHGFELFWNLHLGEDVLKISSSNEFHSKVTFFDKLFLKKIIELGSKIKIKTFHLDQSQSLSFGSAADYREIYFYALKNEIDFKVIWPLQSTLSGKNLESFNQWSELVSRPLYYKKIETLEVVSAYELTEVEHLLNAFLRDIAMLEERLWPLRKKILLNISKYPEEFRFACGQDYIPDWVIATTGGERSFYQLGTKITAALVHELTHLFISQRRLKFPNWFAEGFCEWVQDKNIDKDFLKESLKAKNLFKMLSQNENKNLILIEMDKNYPFENPLYQQAKGFIIYLEKELGKNKFAELFTQCEICQLEEAFLKIGSLSLSEHIEKFCQENS